MSYCGDFPASLPTVRRGAARAPVESRLIMNAAAVADRIEAELAPIHAAASSAVGRSTSLRTARTRLVESRSTQLVSDFLADSERFALIEAARARGDRNDAAASRPSASVIPDESDPGRAARADHRARGGGRHGASPSTGASSPAAASTTTRSCASFARATMPSSGVRPGRHRRRSVPLSPTTSASSPASAMRPRTPSATGTGSRCPLPPPRWTRRGCSPRSTRPTPPPPSRSRAGRPTSTSALAARFGCPAAELAPWHYADPFFQEVPVEGGVDLDPLLAGGTSSRCSRADLRRDSGSRRGASSIAATSSRATASASTPSASTSTGRATSGCSRTSSRAVLARHDAARARSRDVRPAASTPRSPGCFATATSVVTEGIAILMGRLAGDAEWLERVARRRPGVGRRDRCRSPRSPCRRAARLHPLGSRDDELRALALRRSGVRSRRRWWELVERYQLVSAPAGRCSPDWAAKIHVACAPVYYHSLPLRASRRVAALRDAATRVRRARRSSGRRRAAQPSGSSRPGQSVRWDRLIEQATGEPLTARVLRPGHR